jgi:hypothetical protein
MHLNRTRDQTIQHKTYLGRNFSKKTRFQQLIPVLWLDKVLGTIQQLIGGDVEYLKTKKDIRGRWKWRGR